MRVYVCIIYMYSYAHIFLYTCIQATKNMSFSRGARRRRARRRRAPTGADRSYADKEGGALGEHKERGVPSNYQRGVHLHEGETPLSAM